MEWHDEVIQLSSPTQDHIYYLTTATPALQTSPEKCREHPPDILDDHYYSSLRGASITRSVQSTDAVQKLIVYRNAHIFHSTHSFARGVFSNKVEHFHCLTFPNVHNKHCMFDALQVKLPRGWNKFNVNPIKSVDTEVTTQITGS